MDSDTNSTDNEMEIVENNDDRIMKLVRQLIEVANCNDQDACYKAVCWAVKHSNNDDDLAVVDSALAKLLDSNPN